ncbi:MAG: CBS domain-containing protein [Candidatus Adiutrix sp.]|jgi:tRNA nucleotidyltransferase (CCA-adding enzyme)|nr:CBS domain-containing protein [Candidatus Adiutrix sp.]
MSQKTPQNTEKAGRPLTVITTHFNPDYDAVGSMVAARKLYPGALLVFPGGSEKNLRHFFIQSLIHMIEPARVKDVDLSRVGRLVVVDTRQPARLGDLKSVLDNPGLDVHLYDHHPDAPGDIRGQAELVAMVGSTVTILTEQIRDRGLALLPEEATMMAVGLYEDTGSFTFSSTTGRDYLAGAELLRQGADLAVVSQLTVRELTAEQLALLNELIDSAETRQARGLSFVIATAQTERYVDDVAVLAHKMMEIMGLSILFVLVAMDNKVQLVIRSRLGTVDAALIAREFGGGGHPSAAAASIKNLSLTQVKKRLDEILVETLGSFYRAGNLMVYPPISIGERQTLQEAREVLIKFSINVLLVVDRNDKVIGFISEHNISKALYHGLLDYPVSAFMNSEFLAVGPEASFTEIKEIIVDRKQRVLPVIENDKAVGVITRTDLLQVLAGSDSEFDGLPAGRPEPGRRNVVALMREKMPAPLLGLLEQLGYLAGQLGINLYAVGGCVRDLIMRKPSHDVDLTMDGDLDEFISRLAASHRLSKVIRHPRFKTATLETPEGYRLDLSTTRREYYEHPGALPVVQSGSLRMDLYRRDFTINSLAVALNRGNFGELMDFYRGYQDLRDGYIRVLHNLSFVEDPTRAFRAVRFEARLGFKISKMTASLLEGAVRNNFLTSLDRRRLLHELQIILSEDDPGPAIKRLNDFGLLPYVHPKIGLSPAHSQLFRRVRRVRDWLALTFPERLDRAWIVYLMALTDRLRPSELADLAASLGLKKKEARMLTGERPLADGIVLGHRKSPAALPPSRVYRLFENLSWPTILFIMAKTENPDLSQAGVSYLTAYRHVRPLVSGRDLMSALNLPQGPEIRHLLGKILLARLDGRVRSKADELELARTLLAGDSGGRA